MQTASRLTAGVPPGRRPAPASSARSQVVTPDGCRRSVALSPDLQAALYARCLHEGRPGLVELWAARRASPGAKLRMTTSRRDPAYFPPAGDRAALVGLARRHRRRGDEVFVSPLTRPRPQPGKRAVEAAMVVWVDLDDPGRIEGLRGFRPRPHLVVASGSGGVHAYWRLAAELRGDRIDAANRRLAEALGGDPQATDRGRSLRLPGTLNGKAGRPCRIVLCDLARPGVPPAALLEGLPPDPRAPVRRGRRALATRPIDRADNVAPPEYFRALAGVEVPEGGGHVLCPLHEERTPSCLVFAEPERGWHCFGCGAGGRVYDLASALGGGPTGRALRDEAFREARRWARAALGLDR